MAKSKAKPDTDEPVKKKKKNQKGQGSATLFIVGGVAVFVVLLAVAAVSAYFLTRREAPADGKQNLQAKGADPEKKKDLGGDPVAADKAKKDEKEKADKADPGGGIRIAPKINEGNPNKKGGLYVISTTRGAIYRVERKSELRQLAISFNLFHDEYKGANRTRDNFLESIKLYGPIRKAVDDEYYQINLLARLGSDNIIAFERDLDAAGHLCVRANGDISYTPAAQLKKELNIPD